MPLVKFKLYDIYTHMSYFNVEMIDHATLLMASK